MDQPTPRADDQPPDGWLRACEDAFRRSFDDVPIGMALVGLRPPTDGRVLQVNHVMCQYLGRTEAELVAMSYRDLVHPADLSGFDGLFDRLCGGELDHWDGEHRYPHPDGRERWVHLSVTVVRDPHGHPSHALAYVEDITDRKREVAELEEQFRELADNISVGFTLHQIEPPAPVYLSPAYYEIFGFDRGSPMPTAGDTLDRIHLEDRAAADRAVASLLSGERISTELRIVRPGGEVRWVRFRLSPVGNQFGVAPRIAGLYEDVTEQRVTEAALLDSQTRFDQLANNTDVGFFLRDVTGMIYVNAGFRRIFGEDESLDLSAANLLSFVPKADQKRAAKIAMMFQQGRPTRTELTITRRNGEVRWVRVVDDPVFDEDGVAIRAAGTIEDITERTLAEQAARASRVEAELANAAKDAFLSRMSHELRTPLNAVLGFAQLLELEGLSQTQREAVGHILRGGKHLLAMIDDVLDITSIESDRIVPALEPVDVVELVTETVGLMQPLAAANSITMRLDAGEPTAPHVRADRLRLRQVLLNLVSNAVKYNHPGGRVDIGIAMAGDRQVCVSVSDTGIGIAPEDRPRLFQPFERLGHQSSGIEGTGIGLALSQRLTTLMGGRLDVQSVPGNGSTFTITLPLSDVEAAATTDQQPAEPESAGARSTVLTALYIEDNASNVDLMAGIVRRRPGWSLTHARTGHEGLDLAVAVAPTVVLLDLHLPDIDGMDVLRALRANPATAALPVAILSADAGPQQVQRLLDAGAEVYLTKPLDVRQVLTFLDAHAT